jgi:GNAT superfamily N-acetyltransferase
MTLAGALRLLAESARVLVNVETLLLCEAEVGPYRPEAEATWIRPVRADDLSELAKLCGGRRALRKRLERGDRAFVAEENGTVCACVWLTTTPLRLARYGLRVDASDDRPYSYGIHVARSARRRGIGTALAYHVRDVNAPQLGFTRVRYHISPRNPATIRRHLAEPRARTLRELRLVVLFGFFGRVMHDEPIRSPSQLVSSFGR